MPKYLYSSLIFILFSLHLTAQENLVVEGAITIENSSSASPDAGTIRFNSATNDFEGFNGVFWTSLTGCKVGAVSDIDSNNYVTVIIGNQEWMAQNLRVCHYNNGDSISFVAPTDNITWQAANYGAWCDYDTTGASDTINVIYEPEKLGKLYNYHTVNDARGLCPTGWHVPSEAEWTTVFDFLGGNLIAGAKLKESGTLHWNSPNSGTNTSGFTALGGGLRNPDGIFDLLGTSGFWWSSSMKRTWMNHLQNGVFFLAPFDTNFGHSVRCIRD